MLANKTKYESPEDTLPQSNLQVLNQLDKKPSSSKFLLPSKSEMWKQKNQYLINTIYKLRLIKPTLWIDFADC